MTTQQKKLHLKFHGKILDQLGFQTYQSPVASIAELVSNSWDADAETVKITIPAAGTEQPEIVIKDTGSGMTFKECEEKYLNVGWNRRGDNPVCFTPKGRPVLGRKGIGKFAGFGIAEIIYIETISEETGEKTSFEMNINQLRGDKFVVQGGEIAASCLPADEARKNEHGTIVILKSLKLKRAINPGQFAKSMARRFLLHQRAEGFQVVVNGELIPKSEDYSKIQFVFPHDYDEGDVPEGMKIVNETGEEISIENVNNVSGYEKWGKEILSNGFEVRWRIFFYTDTLDEPELQGISIFSNRKLTQRPFIFELAGGLGGQHGLSYMSGQVQADFIDRLNIDPISAERQRINWQIELTEPLLVWGQAKLKQILPIWKIKRGEFRKKELEDKIIGFKERLEKLPSHEAKIVKNVLIKLGGITTLTQSQFIDLGQAVLTSWEQGRLRGLIATISEEANLSESELLKILIEADTISALNIAEVAKTKLETLVGLKERLDRQELENAVRNYIARNPWIISPKWETFRVEKSVRSIVESAAKTAGMDNEEYKGRVDLVLSSGNQLLVLEFVRPGLTIDWDHINRYERYCIEINTQIKAITSCQFNSVTGILVADKISRSPSMLEKVASLKRENMYASDWQRLLEDAKAQWQDLLDILTERSDDPRIKSLIDQ